MREELLETSLGKALKRRLESYSGAPAPHLIRSLPKSIDSEIDNADDDSDIEWMHYELIHNSSNGLKFSPDVVNSYQLALQAVMLSQRVVKAVENCAEQIPDDRRA